MSHVTFLITCIPATAEGSDIVRPAEQCCSYTQDFWNIVSMRETKTLLIQGKWALSALVVSYDNCMSKGSDVAIFMNDIINQWLNYTGLVVILVVYKSLPVQTFNLWNMFG